MSLAEKIDQEVKNYMTSNNVRALVLGLAGVDESIPPVKGYGIVAPTELPPTGSSIFEIGSVTKTFTGAALAWLARPGGPINSIDDPAQSYVPNEESGGVTLPIWNNEVQVTLVDLADFAPGFPADKSKNAVHADRNYQQLFDAINQRGNNLLVSQPGTTYAYADAAFELLGSILAYVNSEQRGFDYGDLLRAFLDAASLTMPDTLVRLNVERRARLVPGFHNGKSVPYKPGDWLIVSTCDDMLVWTKYQMGLLSSPLNSLLPVIQQPEFSTPSGAQTGLGLFFRTNPSNQPTKYWKNGAAEGYSSYITFSTKEATGPPIGVVILTNEKDAKPASLGNTLYLLLASNFNEGEVPTFGPEDDA